MRLFSKTDKNPKTTSSSDRDKDKDHDPPAPSRSSRTKSTASSSTRSPEKSQSKNPKPEAGSPRSSRKFHKPSSRRTEDHDTHPLNLPLDQLQKRLSAMSAKSDSTEVDAEGQSSSMPGAFETPKKNEATEAKQPNGTNDTHQDSDTEMEGPEPPPHKSNSASPVQDVPPTPEQAEEFKAAGNKFYKAKEYKKAIEEYTKGMPHELPVRGQC